MPDERRPRRRGSGKVVMSDADAMTRAVTGRRRKTTTWRHRVQDLVNAHGSEEARRRVGVSKSTWRAWSTGRRNPNKANQAKVAGEWNTRAVRSSMIPKRRASKAGAYGITAKASGNIGPLDEKYRRVRAIAAELPPDASQRIMDAYVEGGPDAAKDELRYAIAEHYFGHPADPDHEYEPTAFLDDLDDLTFTSRDDLGGGYFDDFDE